MIYLHRYIRLIVLLATVTFFLWQVFPAIGSGPGWEYYSGILAVNPCSKYWWSNLLLIQNVVPWSEVDTCVGWGWYLGNDWHFFLISPFIILLYLRNKKLGYSSLFLVLGGTWIATFLISLLNKFGPSVTAQDPTGGNWQAYLYFRPWTRFGPYGVGAITGLLYLEYSKGERNILT